MIPVRWTCLAGALMMVACGCATPDAKSLMSQNERLKQTIGERDATIDSLNQEKSHLQGELDYCTKRTQVLESEKQARIQEAANIRKGVQDFTDNVMNSIQTYFQSAEIVQYVGGELIARGHADGRKNVLLVDMKNTLPGSGSVIGGRAFLSEPVRLQFCLLRAEQPGEPFVVTAITPPLIPTGSGAQTFTFDLPLAGREGDMIGLYFPDAVTVPYDDADTGDVHAVPGTVKLNSKVALKPSPERNQRAYSFGVSGYFQAGPPPSSPSSEGVAL